MGTFNATMQVGNMDGGDTAQVSAIVDTGAGHSMFPESLLRQLGVEPRGESYFTLADGRDVPYCYGLVSIAIGGIHNGLKWPCPVIFGPEGQHILGATTLEIFSLTVDPLGERLIPRVYRGRPF